MLHLGSRGSRVCSFQVIISPEIPDQIYCGILQAGFFAWLSWDPLVYPRVIVIGRGRVMW